MKNSMYYPCHALALRYYYIIIAIFSILLLPQLIFGQCVPSNGTVEGIVFKDANNNGVLNPGEVGIPDILVQAYDDNGALIDGITTNSNGAYAFTNLTDGDMLRLTFGVSGKYSPALMGTNNGSSVQFIQVPACNVGFGLVTESDFCNETTEILTTCFVQGLTTVRPDEPTIVGIPYGFNSSTPARKFAMQGETGSIWGLAWKNSTKEIFSAAFVKQYAGLKSGHDAIFKTSFNGLMYSTQLFTKLSDLGIATGDLTVTDIENCSYGDQVGKIGLGSLVLSPDEKYMYVVNIYNNTLIRISTSNPSSSTTKSYAIPGTGAHAFALKYFGDKLYVGTTIPGDIAQVYAFDPGSETFENSGLRIDAGADWENIVIDGPPAHWLTDIDFTDNGDMLISLSDRIGHKYCNALTNRLDEQKGDLLIAFKNGDSWALEDRTGGKEFFSDDFWVFKPTYHPEITIGGIFAMPGTNSVVATVFDPEINSYSGGLHRYNTTTGKKEASKELYTEETVTLFGKATGFGEIIATCGLPEIEIGNLVWKDENANGIQDASENGFNGLTIHLLDKNCDIVATMETGVKGNYVFNNKNVTGGLEHNQNYYIALDSKHATSDKGEYLIDGAYYTLAHNVPGFPIINSDATDIAECAGALIPVNVYKTNHDFDIGLRPSGNCGLKIENRIVNNAPISVNDAVLFEISVSNIGGTLISDAEVQVKLPRGYTFIPELNSNWTSDGGNLLASINKVLAPNETGTLLLSLSFDKTVKTKVFAVEAKIYSVTNASGTKSTDVGGCLHTLEDGVAIEIPDVCDLALLHTVNADRIYVSKPNVIFTTMVCNQGTTVASGYDITNYKNEEFNFDPTVNSGWVLSPDLSKVVFSDLRPLAPGECRSVKINYSLKDDTDISQIINYAEISNGACEGVSDSFDFDSTPDTNEDNDNGGEPNTDTDNNIDDDGDLDEDDHDPAILDVGLVDLKIEKLVSNRRSAAGESVVFEIRVTNIGINGVSKITLQDFLPATMDLEDVSWELKNGIASKVIEFENNLTPGQTYNTSIACKVHTDVIHPATIMNIIRISEIYDDIGNDVSNPLLDGQIANLPEISELPPNGDTFDDDTASAFVVLICPAEYQPCSSCRAATTPTNGQFVVNLKIASKSGEKWVVESSLGLYDILSPFPPVIPTLLPDGYELTELPHIHPGHSEYWLRAVHLDAKGFSVRLRNQFGDLEQIEAQPGVCGFENVELTGPISLCEGQSADYKASTSLGGVSYEWFIDDVKLPGITSANHTIDWSAYSMGTHQVKVTATPGCVAPAVLNVAIGEPDFTAIACIGSFNVSLDEDCSVVVTPAMLVAGALPSSSPYVVMLTDAHGNPIPNATLTSEHLGTTVMAKLIEGCGGNSCWSSITVEDKVAPVSICRDIILPCYKVDQYAGPFERDNCDGEVTNIIISEKITPLTCNEDYVKYIDRVYQATDKWGNKSALCTMRISVQRPDLDLLRFPHSLTMLNDSVLICNSYAKDEFGGPSVKVTGVPTIAGISLYPTFAPICNIYAGYSDVVFSNLGCTKKILRNWTVYEQWCSEGQIRTFAQIIEITDTLPPFITPIKDFTVTTASHNACVADVTLPLAVVTDSCSQVLEVNVTYPGGFVKNQVSPSLVTLPVGKNVINYTAYDECRNSSQITVIVHVVDKTAPTVICKGELVVGLNSNGEAYLYPQNVNDGSYDGCGIDSMRIAKMVPSGLIPTKDFLRSINFDCEDVGETIMVALRVWDTNGNSNSCMVNVVIQDKHAPKISCPSDIIIDCTEVFTGMNLQQYGVATAIDACGAVVTELDPEFVLNSCRTGYIKRRFIASDGQGTASCTQMITVENKDYFDPLTDVVKPLDYEVSDKCSQDELLPQNLPALYGYPVLTQSDCGMAASTYDDAVYTFVTGACYKIVRTWTVIDWCEMERLGSKYVPYTFQQIIKVNNTVPPFFVGLVPARDTFYTEKGSCIDALVDLKVTGKDECTPDNKLRWAYKIDFYNDGTVNISNSGVGNMSSINAVFPVGLHKIVWSFEDACGNVVSKEQLILVVNNDNPTAAGLESVSVSINPWDTDDNGIPDIEKACIKAWTLDVSSSSLCCTDPLRFSFSADVNDTIRCFDCFDVGIETSVQLWVHDCNGNTDYVDVNIEVQDNNQSDVCERICEQHPATAMIAGTDIICDNQSTTLTASGGVIYNWSTGATTSAITVAPSITTTYIVTVTNEYRCTDTAERTVTVIPKPNISIDISNTCDGSPVTLTAVGTGTYVWSTGSTASSIVVVPVANASYSVTVTSANGCTNSASRVLSINSLPVVNITGDNIICRNESTTLTATGGNAYLWSNGATTTFINVNPISTSTYTVTATDINGCTASSSRIVTVNELPLLNITGDNIICTGTSTNLTATGGITYVWNTTATTATINVSPISTTTYTVTATDSNGCTNTANSTVTVQPLPTVNITGENNICINESTTLTATGGATYVWSNGSTSASITVSPLVTTTYTVTVTDANGCINSANRTVTVSLTAAAQISGVDVICAGTNTNLTASGGGTYVWSNGATSSVINVAPGVTTTYIVTVTNTNGCTGTASKVLTVNPNPVAAISGDQNICLGESTTLTASGGATYLWSTASTSASISVSPAINTTYTVTVTDANGCVSSTSATVSVDPGTLTCSTQNITVYLNALGAVVIDPVNISTGSTGACTNITATVTPAMFFCNDVGVRTVTLTVTNTNNNQSLSCTAQVTIRDTIAPVLVCPQNRTINCQDYNPNAPLSVFGNATVTDNCLVGLVVTELPIFNLNECGLGQIIRTFTASDNSGNTTQCVQIITIQNNNPITNANIIFPRDTTVSNCNGVLPAITGNVQFTQNSATCSGLFIGFTDDIAPSNPVCADTIMRTWLVVDSCQLVLGTNNGIFSHVQTIFVTVEEPVITGPDTITLVPGFFECEAELSGILHQASGCSSLILSNSINDLPSFDLSGVYPVGTTNVVLSALESCGNVRATFNFTIIVVDNSSTDVRCNKTFPRMRDNNPPSVTDGVSSHVRIKIACTDDVVINASYSRTNINDTLRTYFCDDVMLDIPVKIYFWFDGIVMDSCNTISTPLDPDGFCSNGLVTVAGNVKNEAGQFIPNVNIDMSGSGMTPMKSDQAGKYKFPYMDPGGAYDVIPSRNDNPLEGVSTLDLIYIQRHILKTEQLNSPYKMIAADINKDGKISASDIVQLRRVLLGIHDKFPSNTSWRMVDNSYEFPDAKDPFITPFPEKYQIEALTSNMRIDWIGVKTGDVNNSYVTNVANNTVEKRTSELSLIMSDKTISKGENMVSVHASDDVNLSGFQMTLRVGNVSSLTLNPGALPVEDYHYNYTGGLLTISWNGNASAEIKAGEHLFDIQFTSERTDKVSHMISVEKNHLTPEYYSSSNDIRPLGLKFSNIAADQTFEVLGNTPNPWNNETNINFRLPASGEVMLKVRDVTGRIVYTNNGFFQKGENTILLNKEQLGASGILFYDLTFGHEVKTMKMLNIK
jgi:uncharacterized repeat protein (TIGR01451 family)